MAGWGAYLVRNFYIFLTSSVFPDLSEIKGYVGLFVRLGILGLIMASFSPFLFSLQILHVPPLLCSLSNVWPLFLHLLLHMRTDMSVYS